MFEVFKVVDDIAPAYLMNHFIIKDSLYETRTTCVTLIRSVTYGKRSKGYECAKLVIE